MVTTSTPVAVPAHPTPESTEPATAPVVVKAEPSEVRESKTDRGKRSDKKPNKPRQSRNQPRFLVSGESMFFATNSIHRQATNAMDNAFLLSRQIGTKREPKAEDENAERETETNEDQELSSANNGPIRFPYVKDDEMPSHGALGWDEDDEQVTALELLQGVKDGEMMLFALPSFLPIYAQNRPYGIDEEAFVRTTDPKPHDYVTNELMGLPAGKIGKMRVHESGRISLDINGYIVDMNVSIPLRYQQQVATIDEHQINILGDVTHRLVLIPNFDNYQWLVFYKHYNTVQN